MLVHTRYALQLLIPLGESVIDLEARVRSP